MLIGVPKESLPGERRVALIPETVPKLVKAGHECLVQSGAGEASTYRDDEYAAKGAEVASDVFARADIILKIRPPSPAETDHIKSGAVLIGMLEPRVDASIMERLARRNISAFSLDLLPRITRAQSMDVLSSMSSIAGYRCVILAAMHLPRFFPMMMTAAGTISAAKVFVIGAGVAGLAAIATARRLGAVVEAYDTRPAVKEEVKSLGAKFVELPLETEAGEGGYAKAQDEAFYQRQRELMAKHIAQSDVVITTAVVPGKKAPLLVTAEMVRGMKPGSVVIDLAAEQGGNCELTRPDETIVEGGVTIVGVAHVASSLSAHASQMYSRNIATFLLHLTKDGKVVFDLEDEVTRAPLITHEGKATFAP